MTTSHLLASTVHFDWIEFFLVFSYQHLMDVEFIVVVIIMTIIVVVIAVVVGGDGIVIIIIIDCILM